MSEPTSAEARRALPACDLVMKGGITSGVVYPGAVLDLAQTYRFASIGGASAGAIAAAVTAAAEYGARRPESGGGFGQLDEVVEDLGTEGFLERLFQATPVGRPYLAVLLRGLKQHPSPLRRALGIAAVVLGRWRWLVIAAAVAGLALLVGGIALAHTLALLVAVVIVPVLSLVAALLTAFVAFLLARRGARRLHADLLGHGFGLCPGSRQRGYDGEALIEWLHRQIQGAAGLPDDEPLTFAMLEREDIHLQVMTTDLSYARPRRLPFDDEDAYFFRVADVEPLFPAPVVRALIGGDEGAPATARLRVPGADMPVLVAVRMSLSFPLLLSALRLYTMRPDYAGRGDGEMIENWFSDGGISSNFPIHFFDSWLPEHPTFGLDLWPAGGGEGEPEVQMTGRVDQLPPPRWAHVGSLAVFAAQIRDVAQNWRDNAQADLPGYRDRICAVRLQKSEGGLNLNMSAETCARLVERGRRAGVTLRQEFDFDAHRWSRYLTLMQGLERNLHEAAPKFPSLQQLLAAGSPGTTAFANGHESPWCREAATATAALLAAAKQWGAEPPPALGFDRGKGIEPLPTPTLRITPRV